MFQRAPPEVSGFGVMTSTPSCSRSSQVAMPFGLSRTDGENDDRVGHHPLVLVGIPILGDQTRLDEAGDVRLEGEGDDIGRQAALDGAALLAGGRERGLELTPAPSGVAWKSGMISS